MVCLDLLKSMILPIAYVDLSQQQCCLFLLYSHLLLFPLISCSDGSRGGASDFAAGFLLGGAIFGTLGYIFAPQVNNFRFQLY